MSKDTTTSRVINDGNYPIDLLRRAVRPRECILLCIALCKHPLTTRQLMSVAQVKLRQAQTIIADLLKEGLIQRDHDPRWSEESNSYTLCREFQPVPVDDPWLKAMQHLYDGRPGVVVPHGNRVVSVATRLDLKMPTAMFRWLDNLGAFGPGSIDYWDRKWSFDVRDYRKEHARPQGILDAAATYGRTPDQFDFHLVLEATYELSVAPGRAPIRNIIGAIKSTFKNGPESPTYTTPDGVVRVNGARFAGLNFPPSPEDPTITEHLASLQAAREPRTPTTRAKNPKRAPAASDDD